MRSIAILTFVIASACASSNQQQASTAQATSQPASQPASASSQPDASHAVMPASMPASQPASTASINTPALRRYRAQAARARLSSSEAGRIVLAAAQAHGGLQAFYGMGALRFRYRYVPVAGGAKDSLQTVDLLTSTAHHKLTEPVAAEFAWTGSQAWLRLASKESFDEKKPPFPARFWALTPYYFVAMPFVLSDPGVKLEVSAEDPTLAGFEVGTDVVSVTFDGGVGDAPEDTYVLYLDARTHQMRGLRYTVTYAPFFAQSDVKRSPEKLIVFAEPTTVDGVTFFAKQNFYAWTDGGRGKLITESTVSEIKAAPDFEVPAKPEGALLDQSMD